MFNKLFWEDALERALATAAQVFLVALGGQAADTVAEGWQVLLTAAAGGLVLSLIKSIAASQIGSNTSASLLPDVTNYKKGA